MIDKQPLNFRYLDLILALFPNARVIHCRRHPRDTALSLWSQCFRAAAQDYSYDFDDIAQAMKGETELMEHWQSRYADAIRDVRYEDLAAAPGTTLAGIARWLGVGAEGELTQFDAVPQPLATASLWQARQPVYTRSIGRWEHYATLLPALLRFPA